MTTEIIGMLRSRYFYLSTLIFILLLGTQLAGVRGGDFWEHSAVVREFATHPWNPLHPLLRVDVPHAFFSPYLLLVGLFSRITSFDPLQALFAAGLFNFLLFVIGLRFFLSRFFKENLDQISFYSLLFILFFWPTWGALMWSGFYHFKVMPYILPYPSTFSMAVTLFVIGLYQKSLETGGFHRYIFPLVLTTIVIITHPTTALFAFVGIGSVSLHFAFRGKYSSILIGAGFVIGALLLTSLWPYYSFFDLIQANNPEFHTWSAQLYERLVIRLYQLPIALAFAMPLIVTRLKSNPVDALVMMMFGSASIYILAPFVDMQGAGRILSQFAMMLQILLAGAVSNMELKAREGSRRYLASLGFLALFTLALNTVHYVKIRTSIAGLAGGNVPTIATAIAGLGGHREKYDDWRFLAEHVGQYDVVMADLQTSWKQMSFGGKAVASIHPVHWIDDGSDRRDHVTEFFSSGTRQNRRAEIIRRYCVNFILLGVDVDDDVVPYYDFGTEIYRNNTFILIEINGRIAPPDCEPAV